MGQRERINEGEWLTLSELLRKNREKLGVSQEQIARKLKCTRSLVSKVERGLGTPSDEELKSWLFAYGLREEEYVRAFLEDKKVIVSKVFKISGKI